ncbi:hypothetical protein HFN89_05325 [Rhizobium laguerreae]|nr:hypothetical protein [Rhizobium laguerreae]
MKAVKHRGRDFTIRGVASAYEHGYEVSYTDQDDRTRSVQFRIFLNSEMKLVAVANGSSPGASITDIVFAREVADAELASNPSVFHVVNNAAYDMHRLRRAAEQAVSIGKLEDGDPLLVSASARLADLDKVIKDAWVWSRGLDRPTFRQFLEGQAIEAKKRDFDVSLTIDVGDEFRFHPPMGPLELLCAVRRMEQKPKSVVVVEDFAHFTPMPCAVGERREFSWPKLGQKLEDQLSVHYAGMLDRVPDVADHIVEKLADDGVVIGWTRQTETTAFEKILDQLGATGLDPKVMIGSPEGTFSGRVSAIRLALSNSPVLSQTANALSP